MNDKKIIEKLNISEMMLPEDLALFHHELKNGSSHPFFSDTLSSHYVSIAKVVRISKDFAIVELSSKGSFLISKDTLSRFILCTHKKCDESIETKHYTDTFKKKSFVSFVIIRHEDISVLPLLSKLDELEHTKDHVLVAIDGYAASGKSTLAKRLAFIYSGNVFHTDDFFKRMNSDLNDPLSKQGSHIDFTKMNLSLIEPLERRDTIIYRPFDFRTHQHREPMAIAYRPFTIIEGAYCMHPHLNASYDFKLFVTIGRLKQSIRIYKRNGLKRLLNFFRKWIPKEHQYFNSLHIKEQADYVLHRK